MSWRSCSQYQPTGCGRTLSARASNEGPTREGRGAPSHPHSLRPGCWRPRPDARTWNYGLEGRRLEACCAIGFRYIPKEAAKHLQISTENTDGIKDATTRAELGFAGTSARTPLTVETRIPSSSNRILWSVATTARSLYCISGRFARKTAWICSSGSRYRPALFLSLSRSGSATPGYCCEDPCWLSLHPGLATRKRECGSTSTPGTCAYLSITSRQLISKRRRHLLDPRLTASVGVGPGGDHATNRQKSLTAFSRTDRTTPDYAIYAGHPIRTLTCGFGFWCARPEARHWSTDQEGWGSSPSERAQVRAPLPSRKGLFC